ncbi:MAG: hypothetical protein LW854_10370 [Rubrivivax sp.]|nr:hypothetical protein [Rubrivivax sp.]
MNLSLKGTPWGAWAGGLLACLAVAGPAAALPMASEGFWMVMAEAEGDDRSLSANHAITRRDALGAAVARVESPGHGAGQGGERRESVALTYTRLVYRWNLPHAQANLWLVGQAGRLNAQGLGTRTMWSPAVLADWETTRLYVGGGLQLQRAGDWRRETAYARTGFSFYEVEYEEVQPWFILEAKRTRERYPRALHAGHVVEHRVAQTEWMPMLRFIHRRWFVEIGARRGNAHLNLMLVP